MTNALLLRSLLLGVAAGSRSSLGIAGPTLTSGRSLPARLSTLVAVAGELTADKLAATPDRTEPAGFAPRLGTAATGAFTLARRQRAGVVLPVLAGVAGAAAGAFGGIAWRRAGLLPAVPAAVVEDAVAVGLTVLAVRGTGGGRR
jgi:uncharacterized membrane protein